MKKIFNKLAFIFLLFIICSNNVFAQSKYYESELKKREFEEIKEQFNNYKEYLDGLGDDVKKLEDLNLQKNALFVYNEPFFLEKDNITREELKKELEQSEIYLNITYDRKGKNKNVEKHNPEYQLLTLDTLEYSIYKTDNLDYSKYDRYELKKQRMKYRNEGKWVATTNGFDDDLGPQKKLIEKYLIKFNKNPEEIYPICLPNGVDRILAAFFDEDNEIKFIDLEEMRKRFLNNDFEETDKYKVFYTFNDMKKEIPLNKTGELILRGNKTDKIKSKKINKETIKSNNIIYASIATIIILGVSFIVIRKRKNK